MFIYVAADDLQPQSQVEIPRTVMMIYNDHHNKTMNLCGMCGNSDVWSAARPLPPRPPASPTNITTQHLNATIPIM